MQVDWRVWRSFGFAALATARRPRKGRASTVMVSLHVPFQMVLQDEIRLITCGTKVDIVG